MASHSASDATKLSVAAAVPGERDSSKVPIRHQPEAPDYPGGAEAQRTQGTVIIAVFIDAEGKVQEAKAFSGPAELQACAEDCARAWTFGPAKRNGKPVSARFKLTMPCD
jgi:TonB family protein